MKIMLVRPDYTKNYASTIYSSLIEGNAYYLLIFNVTVNFNPRGVLPSKMLMRVCCCIGSHFHN